MKSRLFYIPIDIYEAHLIFSIGKTTKQIQKYIDDNWEDIDRVLDLNETHAGQFQQLKYGIFLIQLRDYPTTIYYQSVLIHEIIHVVIRLMRLKGIETCRKSEEAYTYLSQYLYTAIIKKLYPNKK